MQFLDYEVDLVQRQVSKAGQPLKLSSLNFELLRYFLAHPGKIITRDELMQHVWVGKVVSDATVYKQVKRLKNELQDETASAELIQTIHGQGFMLALDANQMAETTAVTATKKPSSLFYLIPLLVVILVLILYQVLQLKQDNQNLNQAVQNLAILYQPEINESSNDQQAIARSLHAQLLLSDGLYSKIEDAESQPEFKSKSARLRQTLGYENLLHVQVITHQHGLKAHVVLQRGAALLPDEIFEAKDVLDLTSQVAKWTTKQLNTDWPTEEQHGFTTSAMAFEHYLQGMHMAIENNHEAAIAAFEKAAEQDPTFNAVHYQLGVHYRLIGQVKKAYAALEKVDLTTASGRFKFLVYNARASIHYRLGEINQAIDAYGLAIATARSLHDQQLMISPLVNQAFMFTDTGQADAARKNLEEALLYTNKDRQHTVMGSIYSALSSLYQNNLGDLSRALQYAESSYQSFLTAGNQRYAHVALSKWAEALLQHAHYEAAYAKLQQVLDYSETVNETVNSLFALKSKLYIDQLYGRFTEAQNELTVFATKLNTIENANLNHWLLVSQIRQALIQQDFSLAQQLLTEFKTRLPLLETTDWAINYHVLHSEWLLFNGQAEQWTASVTSLAEEMPASIERQWVIARLQHALGQNKLATSLLNQAINQAKTEQRHDLLVKLLNTQLEQLLAANPADPLIAQRLKQLEALNPPPFPHLLNLARHQHQQGDTAAASKTLKQLQANANQWWNPSHQKLLNQWSVPKSASVLKATGEYNVFKTDTIHFKGTLIVHGIRPRSE
ncbi:winged helix-turn-helix domain-containing protein [Marinicella litoralis]|uniref:Transcriptional regulator n=1 Tax=Marinicella litoralis TaxID=644220 RepID=A0A4R6XR65_9GAMM|nr:winged helix-turn-helix domain-containing protein [Marinicella litoralis]TDR22362.1 transcriptional regulator [Marinicella litoralis]